MNILFFLTPKSEVEFVYEDYSLRQTLEKMEAHRYSEVPVINREGKYVGTITEGDLLWYIKSNYDLSLQEAEHVKLAGADPGADDACRGKTAGNITGNQRVAEPVDLAFTQK